MSKLTTDNLQIVQRELERAKSPNSTTYPTDNEVLVCMSVFKELMNVGATLKQDMLSAWAVSHYMAYSGIARARDLL